MQIFPSIKNPVLPIGEKYDENARLTSQAEAGYKMSRPRFTNQPKIYTLNYKALSDADYNALDAFYVALGYGSDVFSWVHPKTKKTMTVQWDGGFDFNNDEYGWNGTLVFRQVI